MCFGFSQIIITFPLRLITLHLAHIGLIDDLINIFGSGRGAARVHALVADRLDRRRCAPARRRSDRPRAQSLALPQGRACGGTAIGDSFMG